MNATPSTEQTTGRRKTVLFCQECDYQAAPDGRWIIHEKIDCAVYECPRCNATVTIRDRLD